MITKEKTREFIDRAYRTACEHGFHDEKLSVEHFLMLVITEISEAVEADRRNLHANLHGFEICKGLTYNDRFKNYVKDSVEDEMADVAIRLFDICGTLRITPIDRTDYREVLYNDFRSYYRRYSFCERAFVLSSILCRADGASLTDDGTGTSLPNIIGAALYFLFFMAEDMNVDFIRHIELKMEYNETRPKKHGKKY